MDWILILGFTAGILTAFASLPQLIKSIKTKHTKDLSLGMFITLSMGIFLWIIYAFLTKDVTLVIANIVTITIILYILILKIKYK